MAFGWCVVGNQLYMWFKWNYKTSVASREHHEELNLVLTRACVCVTLSSLSGVWSWMFPLRLWHLTVRLRPVAESSWNQCLPKVQEICLSSPGHLHNSQFNQLINKWVVCRRPAVVIVFHTGRKKGKGEVSSFCFQFDMKVIETETETKRKWTHKRKSTLNPTHPSTPS